MKMMSTMELSSGGLYFASSGEKIVEVNEAVFTEEDISCKSKAEKRDRVLGCDLSQGDDFYAFTIKFSLNDIFGGRKRYNKTWRKLLGYSYTEFRFPKKRWRSRKRKMKRLLKRFRLYAKGEPASKEEWQIHLKEIGYENDANTRIDCGN